MNIEKNTKIKDDLIRELQRKWIVDIHIKNNLSVKRLFSITATSVFGIKDDYIIIKYYAFNIISRIIKIKFSDINFIKGKINRKNIINNIDFLKITQLKNSIERKKLFWKKMFYKWSFIFGLIFIATGVSTFIAIIII